MDEQLNSYRKVVAAKVEASESEIDVVESGIEQHLHLLNLQMRAWVSSAGSEMLSHTKKSLFLVPSSPGVLSSPFFPSSSATTRFPAPTFQGF